MDLHNQPPANPPDLNYQKDVHNADVRDIMAEWNEGEWEDGQQPAKPQEPATPPVQPVTPAVAEPAAPTQATPPATPTPPTEPAKPVVDEEKLTDTLVTKLVEKLNPQTPEEKKDFAAKLKELNEKAKAENREPTYEEALALLGDEVKGSTKQELKKELKKEILEDLDKEVAEEEKKQAETKRVQEETTKKSTDALHGEWDRQLGILIERGDIPKVLNREDENDPGMVAQKNLFEALNQYAKELQAAGKPVSLNLLEAYMSPHFTKLTTQPGKDAPINGARKAVSGDTKPGLDYMRDVHKGELRDMIAEIYEASDAQ